MVTVTNLALFFKLHKNHEPLYRPVGVNERSQVLISVIAPSRTNALLLDHYWEHDGES